MPTLILKCAIFLNLFPRNGKNGAKTLIFRTILSDMHLHFEVVALFSLTKLEAFDLNNVLFGASDPALKNRSYKIIMKLKIHVFLTLPS